MISIEIIIENLVDSLKILRTGYLQTLGRFGFFFVHNFRTRAILRAGRILTARAFVSKPIEITRVCKSTNARSFKDFAD